jgi:AAA+ ATPase superfamily predicted ATPase
MHNPFTISEIAVGEAFCDRVAELQELTSHAINKANVVLFSPRRYGKTSLVKRVQSMLAAKGVVTLYVDFYGVDSVGSIVENIVSCFYKYCHFHKKTKWFFSALRPIMKVDPADGNVSFSIEPAEKRKGVDLLREILDEFGKVAATHKEGFHVVFDEFQEITELPESKQIEGVMRSYIQTHKNVSYFFVGSRRRILLAMFNEKKRAFFQSAINYPLAPLPEEEAVVFIVERFKASAKKCPVDIAKEIYKAVGGYPAYIQRIPYSVYEVASGNKITSDDFARGLSKAMEEQKTYYESLLAPLSIQQKKLFTAISNEPTANLFSISYMFNHNLGSYGGVQGAFKKLLNLDYIEKRSDERYCVVDPVFALWHNARK